MDMEAPPKAVKHIVSFSGGIGSFITADMVVQRYGKENTLLLFADTLIEDEDLYRFVDDCVKYLGCEMVTLKDGRTPWQVFEDVKHIGNSLVDPCSAVLKRKKLTNWIRDKYQWHECQVHLGIDFSENHRLTAVRDKNLPYLYRALMVEDRIWLTSDQKSKFCKDRGIEPPRLYKMGFPHNNCGGFCVKAGLGQFKMLHEKMPDRYREHESEEARIMANNEKLRPFLRKVTNGQKRYMTMKEYREEFLETNKAEEDVYDIGGCGCALE